MRYSEIILCLSAGLMITGCKTTQVSQVAEGPREAITYAARAKYPGDAKTSERVRVAAVDDSGRRELTLFNLSDNSVPASTLWVNSHYVAQIPAIAPRRSVMVKYTQLIEAGPSVGDLRTMDQQPRKVELQTSEGLFTVQGPSAK